MTLHEVHTLWTDTQQQSKISSVHTCSVINQLHCPKHRLVLMYRAVYTQQCHSQREQSLFQPRSFVTCSVSPSITLSIILCLFLSFGLSAFPSPLLSVILYFAVKLAQTNKHFSQWMIAVRLNCLDVWKKLLSTQWISIGNGGNSPRNQ